MPVLNKTEIDHLKECYRKDDEVNLNRKFVKKTISHELRDNDFRFYSMFGIALATLYLAFRQYEGQPRRQIFSG